MTEAGIARSLSIYYGDPAHDAAMDALYARFVKPGDLVFDIGAHVGDRIASFRRLGARVIAVEANPALMPTLRKLYGHDNLIELVETAIGPEIGTLALRINTANPTVSTASADFIAAAHGAAGWEGQQWDQTLVLPQTTLDAMIARYGVPVFIKIDIEGYEAEALKGLTKAVRALSFEFTTIQRDVADRCIDRLSAIANYAFHAAIGESQKLEHPHPVSMELMKSYIAGLPHEANSGDIYAVLLEQGDR